MSGVGARRSYWEHLGETQTAVSLAILYAAVMFLLRFALSPNLNLGEAEQMLFGQSFQRGYRSGEAPLATWLAWGVLTVSHGSKLSLFLLREIFVAVGLIAFFFAARNVLDDTRRAALAMLFLAATLGMGWLVHLGSFQTTLMATTCCAYLWADTRALTRQGTVDYLVLGIVTGLGALASYSFLVLPFAMTVALGLVPELRRRLRPVPLVPAAVIALFIVAPVLTFMPDGARGTAHAQPLSALRDLVLALVVFALPAAVIFLALNPRVTFSVPTERPPWLRFFRYTMAAALFAAAAVALLFPAVDAKALAFPVLLPLPLYLFLRVQSAPPKEDTHADKWFALAVLACVAIAIAARVWVYETQAAHCLRCREYWPMPRYADTFHQAGFYDGTVVGADAGLAGNLKLVFPSERVVTPLAPALRFGPPVPGECLIVWPGNGNIPQRLRSYVENTYGAKLQDRAMQGDVEARLLTRNGHLERMNFLVLAQGACDRPRG